MRYVAVKTANLKVKKNVARCY